MLFQDEDGNTFILDKCLKTNCQNYVCIGASTLYCYPHALKDLLFNQVAHMGLHYKGFAPDIQQWLDDHDDFQKRNHLEEMEEMMLWLFDHEINFVSKKWQVEAGEIVRRINIGVS